LSQIAAVVSEQAAEMSLKSGEGEPES
jgi:hypothetical protein